MQKSFCVLSQRLAAANGFSPGFVSWWHCGLDSWLDFCFFSFFSFLLWVRLVNAHKSELFHIFIDRRRIWCNCLIMMLKRDLVRCVTCGYIPPSHNTTQHRTSTQKLTHSYFSLLTYMCCTDTAILIAIFQSNFIFRLNSWVLADTACLKWLHVNCVSRADFSSKQKQRGENVTESMQGVKAWQTEKETGEDPCAGGKSRGSVTDSGWRRQLCRQMYLRVRKQQGLGGACCCGVVMPHVFGEWVG